MKRKKKSRKTKRVRYISESQARRIMKKASKEGKYWILARNRQGIMQLKIYNDSALSRAIKIYYIKE